MLGSDFYFYWILHRDYYVMIHEHIGLMMKIMDERLFDQPNAGQIGVFML
ncbi:hypothetical protein J2T13_005072 [Paenibacillus sp. DS2015]